MYQGVYSILTINCKEYKGRPDDSGDKGASVILEFETWDPHGKSKELASRSCPLTHTHALWHVILYELYSDPLWYIKQQRNPFFY